MPGLNPRFLDAHISRKGSKKVDNGVTLKVHEQIIYATSDGEDADYTITLPNVSDAEGRRYTIFKDNEGTDDVTVEGETLFGKYTKVLDATEGEGEEIAVKEEMLLVYSDGMVWHELAHTEGAAAA